MKKFLLLIALILVPASVFAAQIEVNTDVNSYNQTISDNFYVAGGAVLLDNIFEKDIFVAAGETTIKNIVKGDATIIGGVTNIEGEIEGDLRVIGGEVFIKGKVTGDLFITAGAVHLESGSNILGESILIGGEIYQNTPLNNFTKILGGKINLNSTIDTHVEATTQNLSLTDAAVITGSLKYYAPQPAATDAQNITFNKIKNLREIGVVKSTIINLISFWIILRFVTTLILAFVLVYVFKVFSQKTNDIATNSFVKSFFAGLLSVFALPLLITLLFISLVGLPISFLVLITYIFILILAPAISGIFVGTLVYKMFGSKNGNAVTFHTATVGVILLTLLQFVPVVGDATRLIFTVVAIGAIIRRLVQTIFRPQPIVK